MKIPKSKEEILIKLIKRKTPRAYANGLCQYAHEFNGGCAVGCILPKDVAENLGTAPIAVLIQDGDLPRWLMGLDAVNPNSDEGVTFLEDIQKLHDSERYWNNSETAETKPTGLVWSNEGLVFIEQIIEAYGLSIDLYDYVEIPFPA